MNELCFASGLTSSEWAAWVQAIGSIAAIAIAIYVPWKQREQEHEQAAATAHAQYVSTLAHVRELAVDLTHIVGEIKEGIRLNMSGGHFQPDPLRKEDFLARLRTIEPFELPVPSYKQVAQMRALLAKVYREYSGELFSLSDPASLDQYLVEAREIAVDAVRTLRAAMRRQPMLMRLGARGRMAAARKAPSDREKG